MKVEIMSSEWTARDIEVVARFAIRLEELHSGNYSRDFEGIYKKVANEVSETITNKILSEKSTDIVAAIDIDEIIKRIKIGIIRNIATS